MASAAICSTCCTSARTASSKPKSRSTMAAIPACISAKFGPEWPAGYEAQVNNTHSDWRRTGSLYRFADIKEQLIPDDTWWTQQVIANGNHIIIKVNDKVVVDYVDEKNTYRKGLLALQQHNKGSVVEFRNLMMRPLPAK